MGRSRAGRARTSRSGPIASRPAGGDRRRRGGPQDDAAHRRAHGRRRRHGDVSRRRARRPGAARRVRRDGLGRAHRRHLRLRGRHDDAGGGRPTGTRSRRPWRLARASSTRSPTVRPTTGSTRTTRAAAQDRTFGGAAASEFVTPGYVPPQEFDDPRPSPAGTVSEAALEGPCKVMVYTPPGHRQHGRLPGGGLPRPAHGPDVARARLADRASRHPADRGGVRRPEIARRRVLLGRSDGGIRHRATARRGSVAARRDRERGRARHPRHFLRREGRPRHRPPPPGRVRPRWVC